MNFSIIIIIGNEEPQNMVTNMFIIKKSYLYWSAEI